MAKNDKDLYLGKNDLSREVFINDDNGMNNPVNHPADANANRNYAYKSWVNPLIATQINEQKKNNEDTELGDSWKAFYKNWSSTYELDKDKKTWFFGKERKDSDDMTNVKMTAGKIMNFFVETELAAEEPTFRGQQKQIENLYVQLIDYCKIYLRKKRWGLKTIYQGEGYRRYQLVKHTLTRARSEQNIIKSRAREFHDAFDKSYNNEFYARPLWINILSECRTQKLNLNRVYKREDVGGNCNNVIKVTLKEKEKSGFIKESNFNCSIEEKIEPYVGEILDSDLGNTVLDQKFFHEKKLNRYKAMENTLKYIGKHFPEVKFQYEDVADFLKYEVQKEVLEKINKIEPAPANQSEEITEVLKEIQFNSKLRKLIGQFMGHCFRSSMVRKGATDMAKISDGVDITNGNVATYRLAELLGISELIPAAIKVKYDDKDGGWHKGILMTEARGQTLQTMGKERRFAAETDMQLNSLQILDVLTGQVDRNDSNILLDNLKQNFHKVTGIDNDFCFGKLYYQDITDHSEELRKQGASIKPIEDQNGITLKLIDKKVYDGVLALDDDIVEYAFGDLLGKEELKAFLDRIHGVQRLFGNLDENNKSVKICDMAASKNAV